MKNSFLLVAALLFSCGLIIAQEESAETEDMSIKGQYETLIRKSTNYRQQGKRYEVVRLLELEAFQKNVTDSLKAANANIAELQGTIAKQEASNSSLTAALEKTSEDLKAVSEEKDSMSFLGKLISKGTYNLIVWSIIFALLIFLLLFIYKFKNSNSLTQQAKLALSDLEKEFEEHRRRALEREQKISRKLQDEINKNKKGG